MKRNRKKFCIIALCLAVIAAVMTILLREKDRSELSSDGRILFSGAGGTVKTLDPAFADDLASRDLTALCYDTLVQYDYLARPYKLVPSMLVKMPEISADGISYSCELRDDLYFADDGTFPDRASRKVTAKDVKFSILRIADARNHSPVYWIFRGRIAGLDEFREKSAAAAKGDFCIYDEEIAGIKIISERRFILTLTRRDPGFLYLLAMPNAGVVSRRAALDERRGPLANHPAGSGAFVLKEWIPNLRLRFSRNQEYRCEFFAAAENPADRTRRLPLLDGVEISLIRQPMSQWMLFLQGNLDYNALDKDNQETLAGSGELIPALADRGVVLEKHPEFEIRYVGFNFRDPLLGKNLMLRRALRESYDIKRRILHNAGMLLAAAGPIPDGVGGFVPANEAAHPELERVKKLFEAAGFPDGIDPATGKNLQLTFDQAGSTASHRQMGELAADDWLKYGVEVTSLLNSRPRFSDKLRRGKFQLFRYSWIGDYPDGANFLQLFYSGNIGSCNYSGFADAEFDRLYMQALTMPDSPERTELYVKMVKILDEKCVCIFEGFPISVILRHSWLENSVPHDFSFTRWKYLSVNAEKRAREKRRFRPLSLAELSGENSGEHK